MLGKNLDIQTQDEVSTATKGTFYYGNHELPLDRYLCSHLTFPAGLSFALYIMYGRVH